MTKYLQLKTHEIIIPATFTADAEKLARYKGDDWGDCLPPFASRAPWHFEGCCTRLQ
jgi:hypothetical protein